MLIIQLTVLSLIILNVLSNMNEMISQEMLTLLSLVYHIEAARSVDSHILAINIGVMVIVEITLVMMI